MTISTLDQSLEQTTGTWVLDPSHTRIGFSAKHAMITTVRGQFEEFEGTLNLDGQHPTNSSATLKAATQSITTGNSDRDNHLRSGDFLDVETHPWLTFTSTKVTFNGGNEFVITGDLAIRGETRSVQLDVELEGLNIDPFGNERIGFSGSTVISRKDFGLTWNVALEAGGVLVSDRVKISLDVSAVKQS